MGRGHIGLAFVLLCLFPVIVFIPDLTIYGVQSYKSNSIVEQVTKEIEMQGGVTTEVEQVFQRVLKENGMSDKGFTIEYNRTGQIEHRGRFVVQFKGEYTFRAFNLLGTGKGKFTLPITSTDSGLSEVWIR